MIIGPKERLCKDCKHYRWGYEGWGRCTVTTTTKVELVTGKKIPNTETAYSERYNGSCGLNAKNYSRKWWKIWRPR